MALVHYLSDGVTTVQLNDGSAAWTFTDGFNLSNPGPLAEWAADSFELELLGGNTAVLASQVNLGRLLNQAKIWQQTRRGARVFYYIQVDGSTLYRSEVASGEFVPTGQRVGAEWALGRRRGRLNVVRRNWLEGAEAQISLSNDNGTDNTSGLTLHEINTGGNVNWVDITAAKIGGDLPAPTSILMRGTSFGLVNWAFTLARTPAAHGASTAFWSETFSGWSANADAARSNGSYQSITAGAATQYALGADMSAYVDYFNSAGVYRAFACLSVGTSGVYKITPAISMSASSDFCAYGPSQYVSLTSTWSYHDLGLVRFPAVYHSEGKTAMAALKFEGVNGVNLRIDYLAMMRCDGNRRFVGTSPAGLGQFLVDDGIDDLGAYYLTTISSKAGYDYPATGQQLTLQPGYHHRIHVTGDVGAAGVGVQQVMVLYYRPRWMTI